VVELRRVLDLTEGPPHLLHNLHLLERGGQGLGRSVHGFHSRLTRTIGRDSSFLAGSARNFSSFPQSFPLLSDGFERLAMVIADFTRFLCESPEPFRLVPVGLRGLGVFIRTTTVLSGAVEAVFSLRARALGLLSMPVGWNLIVWHSMLRGAYQLRRVTDVLKRTAERNRSWASGSTAPTPLTSVVQDDAQERVVNLQAAVVLDEPELPELVHEEVDA
jgi:hypothetical protein